jgi:small subunit ribosomal protein S7
MPRKKKEKREISPDTIYNNVSVAKFINHVMKEGKKETAKKIVYGSFEILKEKTKKEPLEIFEKALINVKPLLEVRPKRIGGATYQVPRPVAPERGLTLAMRWILDSTRSKKGKSMKEKLTEELIEASENRGSAVKKKEDTHRMAEANRAFAHFAW